MVSLVIRIFYLKLLLVFISTVLEVNKCVPCSDMLLSHIKSYRETKQCKCLLSEFLAKKMQEPQPFQITSIFDLG